MGFMTNAAGAPFTAVYYVYVVEVPGTVAESGINSSIRIAQQILFMAVQADPINAFLIGCVNLGGIASKEHPEVI